MTLVPTRRGAALAVVGVVAYMWIGSAVATKLTGVSDLPQTSTAQGVGEGPGTVDTVPLAVRPSPPAARPTPTASRASRSRATTKPVVVSHGKVMSVTAYCWTGGRTASGVWPQIGMAAGPWPFGTRLHVDGVGVVTVQDRYGWGTELDIYLGREGCQQRARQFGRRSLRVEVVR